MRARIKPRFTKSQYSKTQNLLDGFYLITEDGQEFHFKSRSQAQDFARQEDYELYGEIHARLINKYVA